VPFAVQPLDTQRRDGRVELGDLIIVFIDETKNNCVYLLLFSGKCVIFCFEGLVLQNVWGQFGWEFQTYGETGCGEGDELSA
jgi:hypothetical protein